MAPTTSSNTIQSMGLSDDKLPLSITLEESTFLANAHPFLKQVPDNIVVTPSSFLSVGETKNAVGCFVGFDMDEFKSWHAIPIGKLSRIRFMSIFRFKVWWTTHWIGYNGKDVETETQIMILDRSDSGRPYVLLLPLIEGSFRSSLQAGVDDYVDKWVQSGV